MKRRDFLFSTLAAGLSFATGWRIGFDTPHRQPVPAGVDVLLPKPDLLTLDQVESQTATIDSRADRYGMTDNHDRNLALYIMSVVHCSKPYGPAPNIYTLADFKALARVHCGDYAVAQYLLNQRYGLESRVMLLDMNWHGWVEVRIGGAWELFDSTTNIWISIPMEQMLTGADRLWRPFYTPMLDPSAPAAFHTNLIDYGQIPALRSEMPYIGKEANIHYHSLTPLVWPAPGEA